MSHAHALLTPRDRLALARCVVVDGWPLRRGGPSHRYKHDLSLTVRTSEAAITKSRPWLVGNITGRGEDESSFESTHRWGPGMSATLRRPRRWFAVGAALALFGACVLANPEHASASGTCLPSPAGSQQTGWGTQGWGSPQPTTWEGASAIITDAGGYTLCTSDHNGGVNFSTTWSMVYGTNGLVQSGTMYRWGYGSCVKRWAEQWVGTYNSSDDYYIGGCVNPGDSNNYWQQAVLIGGPWLFRSNVDVTIIRQSNFQLYQMGNPFQIRFASETYYLTSQIPGSSSNHQNFSSLQDQDWYTNAFQDTCGTANMVADNSNASNTVGAPTWGVDAPACNNARTWTNR